MLRIVGAACCAVFVVGGLMTSSPVASEGSRVPPASEAEVIARMTAEERIQSILSKRLKAPLDFAELPLNELLDILEEQYKFPIVIDTAALEEIVVSPDTEISIDVHSISLRSALNLIFRQPGVEDLDYVIDQEVLLITSRDRAAFTITPVVYRVDDLLSEYESEHASIGENDYDALIDLIVSTIEHDSWMENGTGDGEIQSYPPGMLVITQSRRVHNMIYTLLAEIRETKEHIHADRSANQDSAKLVSKGFKLDQENLEATLGDENQRELLGDLIRGSVDWELGDGIDEQEVWIRVLPEIVLVRHRPRVVLQTRKVMTDMKLIARLPRDMGGSFCGGASGSVAEGDRGSTGDNKAGSRGGRAGGGF